MGEDGQGRARGATPGFEQLSGANESNPAEMLRFLRATGGAKEIGTQTVRGTKTTKYRAQVDLRKAVDFVDEDERDEVRKTIERVAKQQGGYTFPVTVFIDDDGLIRREVVGMGKQELDKEKVTGSIVIDLHDIGQGVQVDAPPEDETEDISEARLTALLLPRVAVCHTGCEAMSPVPATFRLSYASGGRFYAWRFL